MTREQQRKLKELKKAEVLLHKKLIKQFKYKKRDGFIWHKKDDMFFVMYSIVAENEGICKCYIKASVKPMWVDDLLWDILDMPENKNEPLSLRSNGAFTVHGINLFELVYELPEWEVDELEDCLRSGYEMLNKYIVETEIDYYYESVCKDSYHKEIHELLILIHKEQYEKAIEYAKSMKNDYFINRNLTLPIGAIEYCKDKK